MCLGPRWFAQPELRYGADCNNWKSAPSASYLAARWLLSAPSMTPCPLRACTGASPHFRLRFIKTTSRQKIDKSLSGNIKRDYKVFEA
jgi:hypothetical protein